MSYPLFEILLVEDNPGDVRLTKEAFSGSRFPVNMSVAYDGVEALEYLQKRDRFFNAPTPHLILLDLNLPRKNGMEVLEAIKTDKNLRRIPVIILSTSQSEDDIIRAYDLHANCFITKPVDFDDFMNVVDAVEDFWFSVVKLPPN
jgi:two-component system response regulator